MPFRQVNAFEYDCDSCGQPLRDEEWSEPGSPVPLRFGPAKGTTDLPPPIFDYELDGTERVDDFPVYDNNVHGLPQVTVRTVLVHAECWHWCADDDVQRKGKAEDCPLKDTHSEP